MPDRKTLSVILLTVCFVAFLCGGVFSQTIELKKILISPASKSAAVGDIVNFQVTITNNGRLNIVSLSLTDLYSYQYLKYVSAQPVPDVINEEVGELLWTDLTQSLGVLEPGEAITLSMTFRALAMSAVAPAINTVSAQGLDAMQGIIKAGPVSAYVNIILQCPEDVFEPNDSSRMAAEIKAGAEIRAYICPVEDVDYFRVELPRLGIWQVRLFDLPVDFNLYVYEGQTLIGSSENKGTVPESVIVNIKVPTSIVVLVRGLQTFSYMEPYRLKITQADASTIGTAGAEPGRKTTMIVDGLPPGEPGKPNRGHFYLGSALPGNLLATAPVLPSGRLGAGVKIPEDASGDQTIVAQVVDGGGNVVAAVSSPIVVSVAKVRMKLWIDDAWMVSPSYHTPIVNKVKTPVTTTSGGSIADVCCSVVPQFFDEDTVRVEITVKDNKLGAPKKAYTRIGHGGILTEIPFTNKGGGVYAATLTGIQGDSVKHLIFRFRVPDTLPNGLVEVTGKTFSLEDEELFRDIFPRKIRIINSCSTVVFVNRTMLFKHHDPSEVAELLANLYIHSDYWWKESPLDRPAMIYYIDQYRDDDVIRNWNNMSIDYSTEFKANEGARMCHQFMLNRFTYFTNPKPEYILIVGNDEQFPFYRYKDPIHEEKLWIDTGGSNPAMTAPFHDYYFTDNFYADWFMGSVSGSWQEGNVDLKVGRIIGDSAADMLQLYLAGLNVLGSTGNAVMASVDGWELGFEPDDGRAGEIPDLISVPGFLSSKGYQVRNDYEYPRTVDALDSYPANWATSFQSAANAGMDLFFIGGHNGYTGASLPYDGFDPADIPSKYYRFDDDLPIVMIVGCHGGLPVPDIGSWGGGSGISMVYNVIHNGARAYYGASGYSYGSPGSLHHCLWAELLLQYNFYYLISGFYQSKTLGYALQMGRINFPFGIGSNVGLDRKTVTEFNLFGIPWQRMEYPGTSRGGSRDDEQRDFEKAMPAPLKAERDLMLKPRKVVKLAQDTYQQSFTVKTSSWADKEFEKFQIIEIPGGEQQLVPDTPVLPAITKHSIALPPDGEILSLQASGVTTDTLGEFNIPTVRIGAWTESGITYTDETDMDYFYPPQLAYSREGSLNNHLITVFPVGHNPKTNETVLHPDFQVTVTYKAPVPFGILDFKADQAVLAPGQSPSFSAGIFNMGDSGVTLAGTLSLTHDDGGVGFSTTTLSIPLVPGSVFNLQSSPAGFPEVDNYRAILSLNDGMGNIVTAETPFSVISAGVMNLVAVWNPLDNKSALSVDVENLTDKTRNLTMAFVIMGSDDVWLDTVYSDPANLAAGETRTMSVVWTSPGVLTDTLKIQAVGALDGAPLNPANAEMSVFTMEALFDSLVDYILNRYTLQPGLRNIFNLNGDDVIDVADVIALIKNTR